MLQIDSLLILCNRKGSHVFQIYNTNTKKLIKECGTFGRGPNEFISPSMTGQFIKRKDKVLFYVNCFKRKKLFTIDLYNLLNGKDYVFKKRSLPTELIVMTNMVVIDSIIIGNTLQGKITFTCNLNNNQFSFWDYYPKISFINSCNEHKRYTLYCKRFVYNDKRKLLAGSFYKYFNQLSFYTTEGKRIKTIKLPTIDFNLRTCDFINEAPGYCTSIVNYSNNIYLSYNEYPTNEEHKGLMNVFDWNGKALKQYLIINSFIPIFTVDEINKKIYGFDVGNGSIVEFDL
jgi:hypothetical protein